MAFFGSVLMHPQAGKELRAKGMGALPLDAGWLQAFGKEADQRALDHYCEAWLKYRGDQIARYSTKDGLASYPAAAELRNICTYFGPRARLLAPMLTEQLEKANQGLRHFIFPEVARDCLARIRPLAGPDAAKSGLEKQRK